MNSEVAALAEIFQTRAANKLTLMKLNFCNLCVKADPAALLGVRVMDGESELDIEQVATISKPDDNEQVFYIIPKQEGFLKAIEDALKKEHPEFIRKTIKVRLSAGSDATADVLEVEVPELDQTRHDVLVKGVDTYKNLFNTQLEAEKVVMTVRIAPLMLNASKEDREAVDEGMNQTCENVKKDAESAAEAKKKELDEALERYLAEKAERGGAAVRTDASAEAGAAFSMKME